MRTFKFYFLFVIALFTLTLSNCASDENAEDNTVKPEVPIPEIPKPEIPHTLDLSYKKVINDKQIKRLIKTNDNGYIGLFISTDYIVVKFDAGFNIMWEKKYGGSKNEYASTIVQDNYGDYMIVGQSESTDGDVTGNYGDYDIWLCKIDKNGNLLWQKNYGGSKYDRFEAIQTNENGFILIGSSDSNDHDFTTNQGGFDAWIVKINKDGIIENKTNIGGSLNEYGLEIFPINNDFIISIGVQLNNTNYTWIIKLNENGKIIWKTQLNDLNPGSIGKTQSGDILVVNTDAKDFILYRLDSNGNIKLRKTITFYDQNKKQPFANSITESKDNGIIVTGPLSGGNDADVILFRTNSDFTSVISKFVIGNDFDIPANILPIGNYNYILPITTSSQDLPLNRDNSIFSTMFLSLKED
ncbi:hypothetical protein Q1W71_21950 [Flavobacterium pectinovorum]|uniref:hypothetical protein n=1 Tax=Flavobacterium pectinovorum TaxID=29533 RepID=UPI00265DBC84|nr:hypothetical protein [Flavobacterium pectinovorum]WKL47607.1 hypothetical protein Q1W71_21950 [Flavobacterium pectinovorum]